MAVQAHYVTISLVRVSPTGEVYNASSTTRPIKECLNFSTEHRIMPDSAIPSSAGYPTIQEYLNLEAAAGFEPVQIAEMFVLTKKTS